MPSTPSARVTYVLPLRAAEFVSDPDLADYLAWLVHHVEVIVVDASLAHVFRAHAAEWHQAIAAGLRHTAVKPELRTAMGKVGGVLTGLRLANHERVIIADDDVRYDLGTLQRVAHALDRAHVVRPQNYFSPLPWHARWDTGRILLNRVNGGDWPGTLGVRRSILETTGGYDGQALFENLELVRTVKAAGGQELLLDNAFVLRRPPDARHFWSQRVRQAYDELARPERLAWQLALLPVTIALAVMGGWTALSMIAVVAIVMAEAGRWRHDGRSVFSADASLWAPLWLAERAVCIWLAVGARVAFGGVRYHGVVLRHAATSMKVLRERYAEVRDHASRVRPSAGRHQSV